MKAVVVTQTSLHHSLVFLPDEILGNQVKMIAFYDQLFPDGWTGWGMATYDEVAAGKALVTSHENKNATKKNYPLTQSGTPKSTLSESEKAFCAETGLSEKLLLKCGIQEAEVWWRAQHNEKPKETMEAMGISRHVYNRMKHNVEREISAMGKWDHALSSRSAIRLRTFAPDIDSKSKLRDAIEKKRIRMRGKRFIIDDEKISGLGEQSFEELVLFSGARVK